MRASSGKLSLRLPRSLHAALVERAQAEHTSLDSLLVSLLAGAIGWEALAAFSPEATPDARTTRGMDADALAEPPDKYSLKAACSHCGVYGTVGEQSLICQHCGRRHEITADQRRQRESDRALAGR